MGAYRYKPSLRATRLAGLHRSDHALIARTLTAKHEAAAAIEAAQNRRDRAADERVLHMLDLRDRGESIADIGLLVGMHPGDVARILYDIDREYAASEAG
jgi:hypothetical protein